MIDGIDGNDFLGDPLEQPRMGDWQAREARVDVCQRSLERAYRSAHEHVVRQTTDLLSMQTWLPRGVAFAALEAPTSSGHWTMRGAVNQGQGDVSSWIVAASFERAPAPHR